MKTQNSTNIDADKSQNAEVLIQNLSTVLPKIEGYGINEDRSWPNTVMNTSSSAMDLSKSRIFHDESRSVILSRKGSASCLDLSPTAWNKLKDYSMPSTPVSNNNNLVKTP